MALSLKHSFESVKADGDDSTLVQPSNWNAEHSLIMSTGQLLGRATAGSGSAEEIAVDDSLVLSAAGLARAALTGDVTAAAGDNATTIADGAVTTAKIADANVTTAKIADANVTTAKIADANVTVGKLADNAVETTKIKDANVTLGKLAANSAVSKLLGSGSASAAVAEITLGTNLTMTGTTLNGASSTPPSSSVGQSQLKTATSVATLASIGTSNSLDTTFAGGEWGFGPVIKTDRSDFTSASVQYPGGIPANAGATTYTNRVNLSGATESTSFTISASQRYITASPPYDWGDGDMDAFVYAMLEKGTGNILATYSAIDPPWAYNGPTKTKADAFYGAKTKKLYRSVFDVMGEAVTPVRAVRKTTMARKQAFAAGGVKLAQYMDELVNGDLEYQPITMQNKMADMPIVPHPFFSLDPAKHVAVLLDPLDVLCRSLIALTDSQDGETAADLLHGGFISIDNEDLQKVGRKGPPGVMVVKAKIR